MTKTVSISLETLLAAKERRAVRQQEWLARHGVTLVSLTLVMPRPVKDSEGYRQVMGEAIKSFALLCQARGGGDGAGAADMLAGKGGRRAVGDHQRCAVREGSDYCAGR